MEEHIPIWLQQQHARHELLGGLGELEHVK